jgi:hypothetical protein
MNGNVIGLHQLNCTGGLGREYGTVVPSQTGPKVEQLAVEDNRDLG